MNKTDRNATSAPVIQEPQTFIKVIGKTTYEVTVHFSKTSTETMADKVKRMIQNEVDSY